MFRYAIKLKTLILIGVLVGWGIVFMAHVSLAAPYRVLIVMSYDKQYAWSQEIKEGIEGTLGECCELRYAYLDADTRPDDIDASAEAAYAEYQAFQPDGIIAVDDDAQASFVVPYLKDQVDTPVIFCGVNAPPDKYGYPASNVTGVLERLHLGLAFSFLKQLVPSTHTVGFLSQNTVTAQIVDKLLRGQQDRLPVTFSGLIAAETVEKAVLEVETLELDALLLSPVYGKEGNRKISDAFGKPVIAAYEALVPYGALCAVVTDGIEQGNIAADMALKAMEGTPLSELPITSGEKGKRILNVTVMKALGIKPKPQVLRGVKLIESATP